MLSSGGTVDLTGTVSFSDCCAEGFQGLEESGRKVSSVWNCALSGEGSCCGKGLWVPEQVNINLMKALLRERPNGVSFDPMAVRLLRQKIPLDDWQIEELKAEMFQLGDGLWFSLDMISDAESRAALHEQAAEWLTEYGCFSVERLLESHCNGFRHISTPEHLAALLRHLGFSVADWGRYGSVCFKPASSLGGCLTVVAKTVADSIEEAGGTLTLIEIEDAVPCLTGEVLDGVRAQFLREIHEAEIGGIPCWCSSETIHLPEDFGEKLTTIVDTMVALGEKVSVAKLGFALNLFYGVRFREEYVLPDDKAFMRVCGKHYSGDHDVFPGMKKNRARSNALVELVRRFRSRNTRFDTLRVPIGTELVFAKDDRITCIVLDGANQVEFAGKPWAISALANHLLNASAENGFRHFCFEGETLWDRRSRLERGENQSVVSPKEKSSSTADTHEPEEDDFGVEEQSGSSSTLSEGKEPANCWDDVESECIVTSEAQDAEREIVGLEGRPLKPATWRAFKSAGTDPRVAKWAQRVEQGETVKQIAREAGYATTTMRNMISNFNLYFKVCELNKIVPEGGADV